MTSKTKKLAIARGIIRKRITVKTVDFSEIISVVLKESNITIANSVTINNALLKGAAGFVIAGGVGAMIGGLSSKSKTKTVSVEKTKSIGVEIVVNDKLSPIIRLTTFRDPNGLNKDGFRYRDEIDRASRLYGKVNAAMEVAKEDPVAE
ncbi:hypothetical protein [Xenorhabdus bovienii]|uniref:hypothetical protein n=1 Tax=Xenorhabdus bovienii TaxID=40576 RepID=UPI0023B26E7A|nr:hypothetical protein [Xenorhabdus bovienii]MDE9568854.1 hypothetical protein [Xenorhabdus bovienii]